MNIITYQHHIICWSIPLLFAIDCSSSGSSADFLAPTREDNWNSPARRESGLDRRPKGNTPDNKKKSRRHDSDDSDAIPLGEYGRTRYKGDSDSSSSSSSDSDSKGEEENTEIPAQDDDDDGASVAGSVVDVGVTTDAIRDVNDGAMHTVPNLVVVAQPIPTVTPAQVPAIPAQAPRHFLVATMAGPVCTKCTELVGD